MMKRVYIALALSIIAGISNRVPYIIPDFLNVDFTVMSLQWFALGVILPFIFQANVFFKILLLVQLAVVPLFIFLFSQNPEYVLLTGTFAILPGLFYRFKEERQTAMDRRVHFTWQQHVQMSR